MPRIGRSFPPQWIEPNLGGSERALGPEPPQIVATAPSQRQQTITVLLAAARHRRGTDVRRFPKQWYEPSETQVGPSSRGLIVYPERALGPDPPTRVNDRFVAPPVSVNMVLVDRLGRRKRRQLPGSFLSAPILGTKQIFFGPQVNQVLIDRLGRRKRRQLPGSFLSQPIIPAAAALAPPLNVNCLPPDRLSRRFRRQLPSTALGVPTTFQIFSGPAVYPATGLLTNWRRPVQRRPTYFTITPATLEPEIVALGERTIHVTLVRARPRPTTRRLTTALIFYPQTTPLAVYPATGLFTNWRRVQQRRTTYALGPLIFYRQTSSIRVTLVRTRPRRTLALRTPLVVAAGAFFGPNVNLLPTDRLARRHRRQAPSTTLFPPVALQVFGGPAVNLLPVDRFNRKHRRGVLSGLQPPIFYPATSTIIVTLSRARPRSTSRFVAPPTTLQVFGPPVEVEITVRTPLEDRRRQPRSKLPLVIVPVAAAFFPGPAVTLIRTRPRRTTHALGAPIFYPATSEIAVTLVRARPRPTRHTLGPLVFYRQTGEIAVTIVRTRPRPTTRRLEPPTTLRTFAGPVETEVAVRIPIEDRRRFPHSKLAPPATLEPEIVALAEREIRVVLVRTRPRHTLGTSLTFVSYPATSEISVALVRTRPRPTRRYLAAPVFYPATSEIQVTLTRIRPRRTAKFLTAVSYPQTSEITVTLVRTRPRPTMRLLAPPATLTPYAVEVAEETIRVVLVRTRPRHTLGTTLGAPTALQTFPGPSIALTRARPRPTTRLLTPPTVIRTPSVEQREQTISVTLTRTRPRKTISVFAAVVVSEPPVVSTVEAVYNVVRDRRVWNRRFPLQGWRQRVVRETGSTVTYQQFDPFLGPRPPQIIGPLPTPQQETLVLVEVARRTARDWRRHFPLPGFRQSPVGPVPFLGVRPPIIIAPLPTQKQQTITVSTVAVRTRVEAQRRQPRSEFPLVIGPRGPVVTELTVVLVALRTPLDRLRRPARTTTIEPIVYPATGEISVVLVHIRPRPTRKHLGGPTVVRVPVIEQIEETIRVTLTRIRPRPTAKFVRPFIFRPQTGEVAVTLVRTRPRPTAHRLGRPIALAPVETRIRAKLVRARPRPTRRLLAPPTIIAVPTIVQAEETIRVVLVRTRPRTTIAAIRPPVVVAPPPPVVSTLTIVLVRTRPRPTALLLSAPRITVTTRTGWTDGRTITGFSTDGEPIATDATSGEVVASDATSGRVVPVAESAGKTVPPGATDGRDKRSGTP